MTFTEKIYTCCDKGQGYLTLVALILAAVSIYFTKYDQDKPQDLNSNKFSGPLHNIILILLRIALLSSAISLVFFLFGHVGYFMRPLSVYSLFITIGILLFLFIMDLVIDLSGFDVLYNPLRVFIDFVIKILLQPDVKLPP